ncbi:hypothetical protein ADUPG1_009467 [Aduncisulcus paluster]|uniref:Uncharacterized protein n=1 Tax=Aduncisulcus paluster TaxID=2918883 RepID=A0ABQ5KVQ6_9EUKA|nr:hypothetical protein ADUPG1_009467 [Aduncisulcus paluster]
MTFQSKPNKYAVPILAAARAKHRVKQKQLETSRRQEEQLRRSSSFSIREKQRMALFLLEGVHSHDVDYSVSLQPLQGDAYGAADWKVEDLAGIPLE